ncbi:MAG: SEC-C domain-containing protein [Nanoarchaeota archaeon]|nr:SEC-C domain-containing protein [Nanoarchaeota archaeon]MBU1321698.1 SEC-C domain-containing protein [Nanoarchaeota archaeon]MBU1597278.1 SEC-C domain-containing protein [Nanoarchaeota archaeon]MBU2442242.1 SEC-C domain-containing protein [Nanoarchaeota archaeon]
MDLTEIKNNLALLAENKGVFYDDSDDELATTYGFLCEEYFAEIMQGIIFFFGKEEYVLKFADILKESNIEYHKPEKKSEMGKDMETVLKKLRKLGRNEPCHCGSGKKYKKCCFDKDIKETGKFMKVDDLWEEGYFAETLSPSEIKEKEKTIHMGHDEDMDYNCKKCNKKISAHNKDWHAGMCDGCFNKEFHEGN